MGNNVQVPTFSCPYGTDSVDWHLKGIESIGKAVDAGLVLFIGHGVVVGPVGSQKLRANLLSGSLVGTAHDGSV
jgi:hypothetical protein